MSRTVIGQSNGAVFRSPQQDGHLTLVVGGEAGPAAWASPGPGSGLFCLNAFAANPSSTSYPSAKPLPQYDVR